jgi:hypothetical protein
MAAFGGKRIFQPMQQKFFEGCKIRLVLHLRAVKESGVLQAFESGMDLGRTQPKIRRNNRHGGALAVVAVKL